MIYKMFHVKHFYVIKSRSRNKKVKNIKYANIRNLDCENISVLIASVLEYEAILYKIC